MSTNVKQQRIAIIGAGVSGILTIKSCKEEEHLFSQIICYEKTSDPGGLWMYREFDGDKEHSSNNNNNNKYTCNDNVTTVMKGTIANSSKEMSAFSDFPPEPLTPNFMHHRKMLKYILDYAEKFDCLKHIQLNTEVIRVSKIGRKISLVLKVHSNGNIITMNEVFDIVLIASGHHGRPYMPTYFGEKEFQGKHSSQFFLFCIQSCFLNTFFLLLLLTLVLMLMKIMKN